MSQVLLQLWFGTLRQSFIVSGECLNYKSASWVFFFLLFCSSFQGDTCALIFVSYTTTQLLTRCTFPAHSTLSWVKESRQAYIINQAAGLIFDLVQFSATWGEPCRHGWVESYALKFPLWSSTCTRRCRALMINLNTCPLPLCLMLRKSQN